jgi:hypothetical protein
LGRQAIQSVAVALDLKRVKRTVDHRHICPSGLAAKLLNDEIVARIAKFLRESCQQHPADIDVSSDKLGLHRISSQTHIVDSNAEASQAPIANQAPPRHRFRNQPCA